MADGLDVETLKESRPKLQSFLQCPMFFPHEKLLTVFVSLTSQVGFLNEKVEERMAEFLFCVNSLAGFVLSSGHLPKCRGPFSTKFNHISYDKNFHSQSQSCCRFQRKFDIVVTGDGVVPEVAFRAICSKREDPVA